MKTDKIKESADQVRLRELVDFKEDLDELYYQYFPDAAGKFGFNPILFGEQVGFGKHMDSKKMFLMGIDFLIEDEDLGLLIEKYIDFKSNK